MRITASSYFQPNFIFFIHNIILYFYTISIYFYQYPLRYIIFILDINGKNTIHTFSIFKGKWVIKTCQYNFNFRTSYYYI